jgi:hypothetical protein
VAVVEARSATIEPLRLGDYQLQLAVWNGVGLVIDHIANDDGKSLAGTDYMNDVLLIEPYREEFFSLVDVHGLIVCRNVGGTDHLHRDVKGRSSRGRMSQGEFYHHDGCSGPVKPRVVEIRCPYQQIDRYTATAIAPYPKVLYSMLRVLSVELRAMSEMAALTRWHQILCTEGELPRDHWDTVQGLVNRTVRRALSAEAARAYFRRVDLDCGAYREPWIMGECRFIANANSGRTMQHRRAYLEIHDGGKPNGSLVKRWPADPHLEHD